MDIIALGAFLHGNIFKMIQCKKGFCDIILIIAMQMCSSIIGYYPTTTTLSVRFIACKTAPANAAAATAIIQLVCPLHLLTFRMVLNSAQGHFYII